VLGVARDDVRRYTIKFFLGESDKTFLFIEVFLFQNSSVSKNMVMAGDN
jgi:hypothetical protein